MTIQDYASLMIFICDMILISIAAVVLVTIYFKV